MNESCETKQWWFWHKKKCEKIKYYKEKRDWLSLSFREVQHFIGVIHRHGGRLLLHLSLPGVQRVLQQLHLQGADNHRRPSHHTECAAGGSGTGRVCRCVYRVSYGPVGEACGVTQVPQVIDAAEELVVQLREADHRNGTVLIESARVTLQTRTEVCQMSGDLLDHHTPVNTHHNQPAWRANSPRLPLG